MEEHYIKDVGKITSVYGVNLEEHNKVIEKQQKRIAELKKDLEFTTKTANELIEIKHKLEQELAELKEKAIVSKFKVGQKIWYIDIYGIQKDTIISFTYFSIQNEILYKMGDEIIDYREEYIFATEQEAQEKLKEIQGNE